MGPACVGLLVSLVWCGQVGMLTPRRLSRCAGWHVQHMIRLVHMCVVDWPPVSILPLTVVEGLARRGVRKLCGGTGVRGVGHLKAPSPCWCRDDHMTCTQIELWHGGLSTFSVGQPGWLLGALPVVTRHQKASPKVHRDAGNDAGHLCGWPPQYICMQCVQVLPRSQAVQCECVCTCY